MSLMRLFRRLSLPLSLGFAMLAPAVAQPEPATPSRFGALFRSRAAGPVHLSKERLLKPLLEKIALSH